MAINVDGTGVQAPSLPESEERVRAQLSQIFGTDLATSPQTPQGQIAGVVAVEKTENGEAITANGNAMSLDRATGTQLDALGSLLSIRRREASRSRVTATVTGDAGVGLPRGSRASTPAGDEFRTLAAVVLSPSGVEVQLESLEEGPVPISARRLTEIVTLVPGWTQITNASDGALGSLRENDVIYRARLIASVARGAIGPVSALQAGLLDALVGKHQVTENASAAPRVLQEYLQTAHSILVVADGGSDADVRRVIETHRGMGVATMTAIQGGTPNETDLAGISNGTIEWDDQDYTGLDLSSTTTPAERAAALTTLLDGTGVTVRAVDGIYIAMFEWQPAQDLAFGTGAVETAFGLRPDDAVYPAGPFIRPRERPLNITLNITQLPGFPADGLQQIRDLVFIVVSTYEIGQQVWANDILRVAEGVAGTRVTSHSVQHNGADVSGVAVPLDAIWTLPLANLDIQIATP